MDSDVVDKKARLVFTDANLCELQEAVSEMFDIFHVILDQSCIDYQDLLLKLSVLDAGTWEAVRQKYLPGHKQRGLDNTNVVMVLLDFITTVDKCARTLKVKLEERHTHEKNLEVQVKKMEEKYHETELLLQKQKNELIGKTSECSGLAAQNTHLQQMVEEKNKRIQELERGSNVQVWEQEKKRLMKEQLDKIAELEEEVAGYRHGNEAAKKRLSAMDSTYKKKLMKEQLRNEQCHAHLENKDVESLSRKNFVQDKDIVYLEKQLYDLQTDTVGVLGGMKTDFHKLGHKFMDQSHKEVDPDFVQLSTRIDSVYKAIAEGDVSAIKTKLPPHYHYIEDEKYKVKRIRRLSLPATVPSQSIINSISESKEPKLNGIQEEEQANPVIVNPKTKKLHVINPVKYFPHMSQQFVLGQYERFTEFDKNGDGSLDLTEIVKVVSQLGFQFNAHELQEAMEEVDRDHNHTLDFFEYLLIIDNLYRRKGKAQLFQEGLSELNKKNMSKSCSVQ